MTTNLGRAAQARRYYHHVLNGGTLTAENVSLMVQTIEDLERELAAIRAEAAMESLRAEVDKWKSAWADCEEKYDRTYARWTTAEAQRDEARADAERLAGCAETAMAYAKGWADADGGLNECDVEYRIEYDRARSSLASHHALVAAQKEVTHD